jgi:hypothetical protein
MICSLKPKFGLDNLILFQLEILVQIVELVIECDKGRPLCLELFLCSFIVVLPVSP